MRSKLILLICIVLCAAGVNICQAGWVGECKYSGASIICTCPAQGLSDPYTYYAYPPDGLPNCWSMTQEEMDAQCEAACDACQSVSCGGGAALVSVVMDGVDDLPIPVLRATATGEGIIERGFQWRVPGGSSSGPLIADNGAEGSFSMSVQLFASTTFYISAYVKYDGSNYAYSEEYEFTTGAGTAPTVVTQPGVSVNGGEALLNGEITDIGSSIVFSYGFIHAMHPNLTFSDPRLTFTEQTDTGKSFQGTLTDLFPGEHYFRAYADNSQLAGYGEEYSFIISGNMDESDKYAWSENTGWLNFNSKGGISVFADHLEGYVWHEAIGWIMLGAYYGGPHTYGNSPVTDFGVNNDGYGNLSGFAWSENTGWINFRTAGRGVTIDPDGNFNGYAWGETIGWIHFGNVSSPYNAVTAWRSGATPYSLTVLTGGQGYGTADNPDGTVSYVKGQPVNLRAAPSSHSLFAGWSPAPCAESFDMPESNLVCTATFDRKSYNLTVNKSGTGDGTVSGGGSFAYGETITVTAVPDGNSVLSGWEPSECAGNFIMPPSDRVCTAIFSPKTYTVHINSGGTGSGTVSGAGEHLPGDMVRLSPVPDGTSVLTAWEPAWCGGEFTMPDSDVTCSVLFSRLYFLSAQTAGEGSGEVSSLRWGLNFPGTEIFMTPYPARNSVFAGWSPAPCAGKFNMPESDLTCTATFNLKPSHTLTVKKDGTGSGTVNGGGTYVETTSVPLSAWPDDGSAFSGWYPPECKKDMEMPTSDLTCTATFTKKISLTVKGTPENPAEVTRNTLLIPGESYTLPDYSGPDFYVKGWSPAPCAKEFTVPASDLTCTASFGKTYKLTVKGSPEDPEAILDSRPDIMSGQSVSIPAPSSGPDFYLKGWSPAPCAENFSMPESDLVCTAEYGRYYTLSVDYVARDRVDVDPYEGLIYSWYKHLEENEYYVWVEGGGKYAAGTLVSPETGGSIHSDNVRVRLELVSWDPPMCSAPFYMPEADVTCTAYFRKAYPITIQAFRNVGLGYTEEKEYIGGSYIPGDKVSLNVTVGRGAYINRNESGPIYCVDESFYMPSEHLLCRISVDSYVVATACYGSGDDKYCKYDIPNKIKLLKIQDLFNFEPSLIKSNAKKRIAEDDYILGESLLMTSQSNENGIAEIEFRRPVYAVTVNISDYSGDTEMTAYDENGAVVESIPVRGETLQEYMIYAEGIIKRIVISGSDAYVDRNVEYVVGGFIGDINFDDSPDLTDAILALQVLSGIQHFGGIEFSGNTEHSAMLYPALSVNGKISLADAILCLQSSAGLRTVQD